VSAELLHSPLCLFSSSKTHLAAGNRESKCHGFNDHTFSQEETLAGGVPNVHGLHKHRFHRNSRTAKKETNGPAGVASALSAQPVRPGSVLLSHCALQLAPPQLRTGLWRVRTGCVAGAHQGYRLGYLQGQGRLMRPPRDGSLRIHPSLGPLGRTIGTDSESVVLAGYLLPAAVLAHLTDTGMVAGHPAPAQPELSLMLGRGSGSYPSLPCEGFPLHPTRRRHVRLRASGARFRSRYVERLPLSPSWTRHVRLRLRPALA
jgi:hypothetical protein